MTSNKNDSGLLSLPSDFPPLHTGETTPPSTEIIAHRKEGIRVGNEPTGERGYLKGKHTILIVDDEASVLKSLMRALADEGYSILTADSGANAMMALSQNAVSLIISDYKMPGMNGYELLSKVKEVYPHIVRIMLTGAADTDTVMKAIDTGVLYKFVTKPWINNELKQSVLLALGQFELVAKHSRLLESSSKQQREIQRLMRFAVTHQSPLGEILIRRRAILPAQLEMVEKYCQQQGTVLFRALTELGMIKENFLTKIIQEESNCEFVDLGSLSLLPELKSSLPRDICEAGCLVPFADTSSRLKVAMADTLDVPRIDYISFIACRQITPFLATMPDIQRAINKLFDASPKSKVSQLEQLEVNEPDSEIDVVFSSNEFATPEQLHAESTAPTAVALTNSILAGAIKSGASDIHIEPKTHISVVRYRIDGMLHERAQFPKKQHRAIISRIKILAKIDISVRRIPQDGRLTIKHIDNFIDVRVSTMPTLNGEKIVCRLLDKNASIRSIEELGVTGSSLDRLKRIIDVPQGIIISTGPTGSGKTSTLYSLLNERMSMTQNFVTIEDPVEYFLEPASQVHIHAKAGLTFASTLRATLRQDPDVILVGEIRDFETALAAFQAAMTGHLVFSSLHTNSTVGAISRLLHLGVEPFLVASCLTGIIAQRLVRRICTNCKTSLPVDAQLVQKLGFDIDDVPTTLPVGEGCSECDNSGYRGRIGVFEVFCIDDELRQVLTRDFRETELSGIARSMGMETLLEDGKRRVIAGETTLEELFRVFGPVVQYEYNCDKCSANLNIEFSTCPYCGHQQKMFCLRCNASLEQGWKACPFCGKKVITE